MTPSEFAKKMNGEVKKIQNEKLAIKEKIEYWLDIISNSNLSQNDKLKKEKELIDLGAFLHHYDNDIEILEGNRESPDFILRINDKKIGIELTDLIIDQFSKKTEGTIQKLFDKVQTHLNALNQGYSGFYGVNFKKGIIFRKNSNSIVQEIVDIITKKTIQPRFIEFIHRRPHSKLVLHNIQSGAFGNLERQVVESVIKKKEKNIDRYNIEADTTDLWHLIVIGGSKNSDDYDSISDDIKTGDFISRFDKVFLFDFFRKEITELYIK